MNRSKTTPSTEQGLRVVQRAVDGQRLLTVADVADLLNVSVRAVYHLRHRGVLPPAIKFGNSVRWRRLDVEKWLEGHLDDGRVR